MPADLSAGLLLTPIEAAPGEDAKRLRLNELECM
jgi:hypothetical protein